jgi:ketosteroid isomerase-like protein
MMRYRMFASRMAAVFSWLLVAGACASSFHRDALQTSGSDQASTIKALDAALQQAVVDGDTALLERHLPTDFLFTHGLFEGRQDSRSDWLSIAQRRNLLARDVSEQVVELHGDTALVLGELVVKRKPSADRGETQPQCYRLNYVHLYERRGEVWMFVSHRTAAMVETPHACS